MANVATLDDIALGDIDPAGARAALSQAFGAGDPRAAQRAYAVLRAWVWKALDGRRRDPELREWFDLLKRAASYLKTKDSALAERVVALHELVHESITVSERLPIEEILQRRHVRDVLAMLVAAPSGRLDRAEVGRRLGLKQGNLTRVLNMVTEAGLAERAVHGKQAEFQLTRAGEDAAGRLGLRKPASARAAAPARDVAPARYHGYVQGAVGLDAHETFAGIEVVRLVERQGMILTGYSKGGPGIRTVQAAARRNLHVRPAPTEPVPTAAAQTRFGSVPVVGTPVRKSSNAWADALHD